MPIQPPNAAAMKNDFDFCFKKGAAVCRTFFNALNICLCFSYLGLPLALPLRT